MGWYLSKKFLDPDPDLDERNDFRNLIGSFFVQSYISRKLFMKIRSLTLSC